MRTTSLFFAAMFSIFASFPAEAQRTPLFRDFPTGAVYVGHHSNPDLSSRDAYNYRTRLREASQEDVNFASHYRVVTWGCGTSCIAGAVIDVISGRVTFFPFSICCSVKQQDADFQPVLIRPNSKLIVFVGMKGEEPPDAAHFYEFDGDTFRYITSSSPFDLSARARQDAPSENQASAPTRPSQRTDCWSIIDSQMRLDCYDGKLAYSPPPRNAAPSMPIQASPSSAQTEPPAATPTNRQDPISNYADKYYEQQYDREKHRYIDLTAHLAFASKCEIVFPPWAFLSQLRQAMVDHYLKSTTHMPPGFQTLNDEENTAKDLGYSQAKNAGCNYWQEHPDEALDARRLINAAYNIPLNMGPRPQSSR